MDGETDGVAEAIAGELRLMEPDVRTSRSLVGRLLDPDFTEVGASGRRWSRAEILAELPGMQGSSASGPRYDLSGVTGVVLAPGLVHLTYEAVIAGRRARRSSIWRRGDEGGDWRLYYHQATPVPPGGA
ncbi:MAG TPA: DUF4440 domain-containing protein [Streptomyces sp.]|nr:DUF4440 domain-containing protein [Streptomyces sp.]